MDVLRLTLRQLQIFAAVARLGSTTAAGAEIALSQSATSSAVNELERLLSLQLFDRAGKRLLLNENGRALLPRALALLDAAAGVEHFARAGRDHIQSLRIGASSTIGNYLLPALLGKFFGDAHQQTGSDWKSAVAIGNTAAICEAVAAFELDVGLIEGPSHETALQVFPWVHDEVVIVAAADSALVHAPGGDAPVSVAALRDSMWLLRESGSGTREATDQALLPHLHAYRRSIELGSSEAIKHAAAEGLGIACLSRWVVDDLIAAGRLRAVRTSLPTMMRQCHVVIHRDKQMTPALRQFMAQLLPETADLAA
jgi:DNA-binding transcriptional LysR family regulator